MATRLLCAVAAMMTAGVALAPTAAAQQPPSSDASLFSLSFESDLGQTRMFPLFDAEVLRYDVAVPSGETEVTVKAATNHPEASVVLESTRTGRCCIDELDYNDNTGVHTLELRTDGFTYMTVKVTAEDGSTTREYRVYVDAASSDALGWRVYNDVPMDRLVDDSRLPSHYVAGVWADESRVFVTGRRHDPFDQKLFAFNAADSSRQTDDEFVIGGDAGIWSDGTTLWAMDFDGSLRAYNLSTGSENPDQSTDVSPDRYYDTREVEAPRGIWSDGDTLWVVDHDNAKVVAFALPTKCDRTGNYCRRPIKDFDLAADNDNPWGITAGSSTPGGDVDTWWVTNVTDDRSSDKKLYAYIRSDDSSNGSRNYALDIDLKETLNLTSYQQFFYGLAATDTIMYVSEYITGRVYSFSMPGVMGPVAPALASSDATLSSLSLTGATLTEPFSKDLTFYLADAEPEVESITVMAAPSNSSAKVKINGTISTNSVVLLGAEGSDTIVTVEVTAQDDKTTQTYEVTVRRRQKSTDATLSSLVLTDFVNTAPDNEVTLTPGFTSGTANYTATVPNPVDRVTVTGIPSDLDYFEAIVINGTDVTENSGALVVALDAQEVDDPVVNTITVAVTPEDGPTETYTVTVTRERLPSNIATLDELELDNVNLSPTFASDHSPYTSTVDNGVSSTVIKFKRTNQFATVAIQAVDPNAITTVVPAEDIDPSGTALQLAEGVNTVTVTVTSEDMSATMDYVLTITRAEPSNDSTLTNLSFNPGALSRNGASVTFDADSALYDVDVLHDDDSTELSYRKTNSTAAVEIGVGGTVVQGTDGLTVTGETTLHSSDASDPPSGSVSVPLATVGSYTVTVKVTAEDTTTTNLYVFTIRRPEEPADNDATLGELWVQDAESRLYVDLDPAFESGETGKTYDAEVKHGVMSIAIYARPKHPDAAAQLKQDNRDITTSDLASESGQTVSLVEGTNELTILVTAEVGNVTQTYIVNVVQLPPDLRTNARLVNLVLRDLSQTDMTLTQASDPAVTEFAPEVTEYIMSVDHGVTKLEVLPSREDPDGATVEITGADPGGFVSLDVVGENVITVVVTAEDINYTETYTVTVTREDAPAIDNATLSSLTLSVKDIGFTSGTDSYTVSVVNGVDEATVSAVAKSANAEVTITLGDTSATADASVSLDVPLALDANVITIDVTAEDGVTTKTPPYKVTVNRARPPSSNTGGGNSNRPGTSSTNTGGGSSTPIGGSNTEPDDTDDEPVTTQADSDTVTPLGDVGDADADHQADINELHGLGVFIGTLCQANSLCPNDPMARWIAAVWLVRFIDGDDPAPVTESRFADVHASTMWEDAVWYAPHVERLAELEITVGCSEDPLKFCPDVMLRKAQVASWIARAFDLDSASSQGFVDAVGSVHEANINAAVAAGVMEGCSTDPKNFCLDDTVTRGEMASYVNKARKAASN